MINRDIPPQRAKGIFAGMNPEFGNDLVGNLWANSRVTYPGVAQIDTAGEDAWLNFPIRVQSQQATSNPQVMSPGMNLSNMFSDALAQKAGVNDSVPAGDTSGGMFF